MTIDVEHYQNQIKAFGKFEGCKPIIPYLWDCLMDGDGEEIQRHGSPNLISRGKVQFQS